MADEAGGKRFPFINLEKALGRAQELYNADPRGNEMSHAGAFAVWDYSEKSSGGFQTLGALRAYGLLAGEEAGKVKLSKQAFDYFRDEREDVRAGALRDFALRPPLLRSLWAKWRDHPPADTLARTYLKLERGLNEQSARTVLGIYKDNLAFANLKGDVKIPELETDKGSREGARAKAKVGDYIQWTSNGVDQFPKPVPVEWVAEDGSHLWVVGSLTGIPMSEVTVSQPPTPKPPNPGQVGGNAAQLPLSGHDKLMDNNNISVALIGNRLRITADVDGDGLDKLEQAIGKFKEVLRMLQ